MHVHIIDHNSVHIPRLAKLMIECLPDLRTLTFAKTHDSHEDHLAAADLVIVSGGTWLLHKNPRTHSRITQQVVASGKPIFGICLGAESLAQHFGAEIYELEARVAGLTAVTLQGSFADVGLASVTPVPVYEYHKWAIKNPSDVMQVLATSNTGVELFRHADLPIWGAQFHPEVRRELNAGKPLFIAALRSMGFRTI